LIRLGKASVFREGIRRLRRNFKREFMAYIGRAHIIRFEGILWKKCRLKTLVYYNFLVGFVFIFFFMLFA